MIKYLFVTLLFVNVQATGDGNGSEYLNLSNFTYPLGPQSCDLQSDCFNCTLSNCNWEQNSTSVNKCVSKGATNGVTLKEFLKNAPTCGDPGKFCSISPTPGTMKFGANLKGVSVPPGYFCFKNYITSKLLDFGLTFK